ncbi:MAG: alpha-ketoacid dehydrogenase subunit beta [Chloroflexi bacterium]|nr:alpha-ketoacid dehydrogenase subunit beta [Ktedonobacteraceae bacterium]MBV9020801.1 alpha-ketoacid dehydrogenase subunit beta [Ktedonobacteraceae bacterium]MBV9706902.1 alpha-ketoacid dehydrogenase subunit beta [Chloroflexota bacterium]
MPRWTMIEALNNALALELEHDRRVLIFGEDVGKNGGVFRVTEGLQNRFGEERVFDTPLAESAIIGTAIGIAVYGLRPIAEIQFAGFSLLAFNQIVSQAAHMRSRSGGLYTVPLVIRAVFGGNVRSHEMHSDNIEGLFMHTPGIKIVIPSNPYDAKGLLHAAIADPDPVLLLEHMRLYRSFRQEVPAEYYTVPIGKAVVVHEGSDVTVIAYGAMVAVALEAAKQLESSDEASVEVVELRTIAPMDEQTIADSVNKTGRAVVVHEAARTGGVGAEIVAVINQHCLYALLKPVERVTSPDTPFPIPTVEDLLIPTPGRVVNAIRRTLEA